jgi:hypothetical protein
MTCCYCIIISSSVNNLFSQYTKPLVSKSLHLCYIPHRKVGFAMKIILVFCLTGMVSRACTCPVLSGTTIQNYFEADRVFTGKVLAVTTIRTTDTSTTRKSEITMIEYFKGRYSTSVVLDSECETSESTFEVGHTYIFFVKSLKTCRGTMDISSETGKKVLEELRDIHNDVIRNRNALMRRYKRTVQF